MLVLTSLPTELLAYDEHEAKDAARDSIESTVRRSEQVPDTCNARSDCDQRDSEAMTRCCRNIGAMIFRPRALSLGIMEWEVLVYALRLEGYTRCQDLDINPAV